MPFIMFSHPRKKVEPAKPVKRGLQDLPLPPVLPTEDDSRDGVDPTKTPPSLEKEHSRRKRPRYENASAYSSVGLFFISLGAVVPMMMLE